MMPVLEKERSGPMSIVILGVQGGDKTSHRNAGGLLSVAE